MFSYYIALLNNEYLLFGMPNHIVGLCSLNSHKLYRTYNPNLLSFSNGFTQINENEILLTGGTEVISLYSPELYRSKYAAILSIK